MYVAQLCYWVLFSLEAVLALMNGLGTMHSVHVTDNSHDFSEISYANRQPEHNPPKS
jgi:hypothetical protein